MYCPRCGQQQATDDMKYCSRCGMPLGLIPEIILNNGTLPRLEYLMSQKPTLFARIFTKRNGVVFSSLWALTFLFLTILAGIADGDEAIAFFAVFGFISTIMLLIISLAFFRSSKIDKNLNELKPINRNEIPSGDLSQTALPPSQAQPASFYAPPTGSWRAETGEVKRPPSVTDPTTKLLQKDEDQ